MIRNAFLYVLILITCFPATMIAQEPGPEALTIRGAQQDPGRRDRQEVLISHGIEPTPQTLIAFLDKGFAVVDLPEGLPRKPEKKSQVVNAAIVELGLMQTEAAVPILEKLALQETVPGVDSIIRRDLEMEPIDLAEQTRDRLVRFFSLNAIISLGWIGDPRAEDVILEVMRRESGTAFITKGAISLGQMGSNKGLPAVMLLASNYENMDSLAAFQTIWVLTGRNYGYSEWSSLEKRRQIVAEAREWFEREGAKEPIYRHEVNRRLQTPLRTDTTEPGSLRNLLRASRDVTDYDNRYFAREKLESTVQGQFTTLRRIAEDQLEDIDIRLAAMQYLAAVDPKKARGVIDDLEDDENEPIAAMAKSLEKDIKDAIRFQKEND